MALCQIIVLYYPHQKKKEDPPEHLNENYRFKPRGLREEVRTPAGSEHKAGPGKLGPEKGLEHYIINSAYPQNSSNPDENRLHEF
jgi:hypothetical protein